ncbi:hypothetical protein [Streptosporangium sp. NPDC049644]
MDPAGRNASRAWPRGPVADGAHDGAHDGARGAAFGGRDVW